MARTVGYTAAAGRGDLQSVTRGYRNRDSAGPQSKPAFRDLQAHWYAKLKAEGFRDIEGSRDTNKLHWSTLPGDRFVFQKGPGGGPISREGEGNGPGGDFSGGPSDVDWSLEVNARIFGGELETSDLPEAKAWRALSVAAHELPRGWRGEPITHPGGWRLPPGHPGGRAFIIDACQTGCIALHLLQRHKLTRGWARKFWRDFVAQAKMPEAERLLVNGCVEGHANRNAKDPAKGRDAKRVIKEDA